MGRSPCCEKVGLKKGPWTPEEDQKLLAHIDEHGHGSWRALPAKAGLQRCGKSCRLRWTNYLRPDIKRGKFSPQEEHTIIQLHALLGNRWSAIATHLPKRTDNEIKNYWNTHLRKRLAKMGIDPVTHKHKSDALGTTTDGHHSKSLANLSHMAQWESARLEAEARLVRQSNLRPPSVFLPNSTSSPPVPPQPPARYLDVLRAWQGFWAKPSSGGVEIESPTSSFSESLPPIITTTGLADEEEEWRGFVKPMRLLDGKESDEDALPGFFNGDGSWLAEPLGVGTGPSGEEEFGAGYTGMLMESPDEHNSSEGGGGESDNVEGGGSCVEEGEEENKNYWSSILNLVNSSPSHSPPVF